MKNPAISTGAGFDFFEIHWRPTVARIGHLVEHGLARQQGQRIVFARDLLATLRRRELEETAASLSAETGLAYQPSTEGDRIAGLYRRRVTLSSGWFAMIDDGLGFQLVLWRPTLEQNLERQVSGVMLPGGRGRLGA